MMLETPIETDVSLLERWRAGDPHAGEQLLERHFEGLFRFFRNKVDGDFDDLLQHTMLQCVEGRDQFRGRASFRTYLFAIARNVLVDRLRQRYGPRGRLDFTEISIADLGTSPSTAVARDERRRALHEALRSLPLEQQIAIELVYWEGMNATEVGHVLGIPPATVRTRLKRARARLGNHLQALQQA